MSTDADYFKNLAKQKKAEEEKERKERQSNFDFTPLLWSSFANVGESKIVRFRDPIIIEKKADLKITDADGKLLFDKFSGRIGEMVWIYGDNGKKKLFFVPNKEEDPGHIFWRLHDLILKREWANDPDSTDGKKKPIYVHQHNHPELVDRFLTNGFNHGISKNKFDRGWKPQQILMANILDYEMMDVHRERKSWALISKNVNIVKSEVEGQSDAYYYDWGIPAYGFINQLRDTISHYGGLNSYDVLIERTGNMDIPWKVRNAFIYKAEVPEHLQDIISNKEELTEEQLSWEMYDLEDMMKPSSNLKWFKNLKSLLMEIDLKFKTHFHDEMEEKAKKEQEEIDAKEIDKKEEDNSNLKNPSVTITKEKEISSSTRSRRRETKEEQSSKPNSLPITWETLNNFGYKVKKEDFTDTIKGYIDRITNDGRVVWKEDAGNLIPDDSECGFGVVTGNEGDGFESPDNPDIPLCLYCGRPW